MENKFVLLLLLVFVVFSLGCTQISEPVCGNGICEIGEDYYTCSVETGGDCYVEPPIDGTQVEDNTSTEETIELNQINSDNVLVWLEDSKELVGFGTERLTSLQREELEKTSVKTEKIKLNKIGLERVNEVREKKGKSKLTKDDVEVVEIGREVSAKPITDPGTDTTGDLPAFVDNSLLKYFPPIRSQGSLNSCGQFSAVYYLLTHMTAMANDFDAKNGGDAYRFSPKWTYNMVNGGSNMGSYPTSAYMIAQKHGLMTWEDFPYDADYREWNTDSEEWREAIDFRADQYGTISGVNTDTGILKIKELLNNGYVLNFSTYFSSWQKTTIIDNTSTTDDDAFVGQIIVSSVSGTSGGHAMTIVGYNDTLTMSGISTKGAFKVANSWGPAWNGDGFMWVSYNAFKTKNPAFKAKDSEGLAWYDEAYWATARTNYKPKLLAQFNLGHNKRSQIVLSAGVSNTDITYPTTTWTPNRVLVRAGGIYSFDGGSEFMNSTFYYDLTDLYDENSEKRYYMIFEDGFSGDPFYVNSFKLINTETGEEKSYLGGQVKVDLYETNRGKATLYIDYDPSANGLSAPVAIANAYPIEGYPPLTVHFDSNGSYDDGVIVDYNWNLGDGSSSNQPALSKIYNEKGNYTVMLTVTDDNSLSTTSAPILITVKNKKPVIGLDAGPLVGTAPLTIYFDASHSYDLDGNIVSYQWDFGDGSSSNSMITQHTYEYDGSFDVTLTITDDSGDSSSNTFTVTVQADADNINAPSNLSVKAKGTSIGLTWSDNSNNETHFVLELGVLSNGSLVDEQIMIVPSNTTTYSISSLGPGEYYFKIKAVNKNTGRESTYSNIATTTMRK